MITQIIGYSITFIIVFIYVYILFKKEQKLKLNKYKEGGIISNIYEHPLTKTMVIKEEIEIEHKPMIDFKDIPFGEVDKTVKVVEKIPITLNKPTPGLFITDKYRNIPELNRMKEHVKNGNII